MLRFNPTREECAVLDEGVVSWEEAREFILNCEDETLECECAKDRWSRDLAFEANWAVAGGELWAAISRYDKAILLDQDNFGAWFGRACAYFIFSDRYGAGFYDEALGSLDGALSVQSLIGEKELFAATMLRSATYFAMGNEDAALGLLEQTMPAYSPATPEGAWIRALHGRIRGDRIEPFSLFGAIFGYFYLAGDSPSLFVF